jgi:non-specific serine/threonine protein kinase/serine/threonine-protein kinase
MELVAGEPITDYCDRHSLTTRQRLELFVQICHAIQHAHTKGIIHRDLKPSNILVGVKDGAALAKVIDFGIAKAMSGRLSDRTLFTEQGQLIGTPEYMSPEQAEMSAIDIDTRADIYSLGVMLYELLAGAPPVDSKTLRRAAYAEIQRMIRELDPPSPSLRLSRMTSDEARKIAEHRRAEVAALSAELKRELEWIPLKAMRKDRTERYQTAKDLATDIENYLQGRPLLAGPETGWYRTQKFVKRNKLAVAVTSVMFLLLLSMLGVTLALLRVNADRNKLLAQALQQSQEQTRLKLQKEDSDRQRVEAERRQRETEEATARVLGNLVAGIKDKNERERVWAVLVSQFPFLPPGARDPSMLSAAWRISSDVLSKSDGTTKIGPPFPAPRVSTTTTVPAQ